MRYVAGRPWTIGRVSELDALRGIAILLVVVGHWWDVPNIPPAGVTIFFVLSGFLITSLLVREYNGNGSISLRRFYARRARRLMPALGLLLAVVVSLDLIGHRGELITARTIPSLFYCYNWVLAGGGSPTGDPLQHTWSLSVEEQFYLAWPFVLLLALSKGRRCALYVALALLVLSAAERAALSVVDPSDIRRLYYGTDTNLMSLMTGCATALAASIGSLPEISRRSPYIGLAMMAVITVGAALGPTIVGFVAMPLVVTVATAVLIVGAISGTVARLNVRPLALMGTISYSLYLWQTPVSVVSVAHPQQFPLWMAIVVTGIVAVASHTIIERPFLYLSSRVHVRTDAVPSTVNTTL